MRESEGLKYRGKDDQVLTEIWDRCRQWLRQGMSRIVHKGSDRCGKDISLKFKLSFRMVKKIDLVDFLRSNSQKHPVRAPVVWITALLVSGIEKTKVFGTPSLEHYLWEHHLWEHRTWRKLKGFTSRGQYWMSYMSTKNSIHKVQFMKLTKIGQQ